MCRQRNFKRACLCHKVCRVRCLRIFHVAHLCIPRKFKGIVSEETLNVCTLRAFPGFSKGLSTCSCVGKVRGGENCMLLKAFCALVLSLHANLISGFSTRLLPHRHAPSPVHKSSSRTHKPSPNAFTRTKISRKAASRYRAAASSSSSTSSCTRLLPPAILCICAQIFVATPVPHICAQRVILHWAYATK